MMFKIRSERFQPQATNKIPKTGIAAYKIALLKSKKLCQGHRPLIKTLIGSMTALELARSVNARVMMGPSPSSSS
jgi:hypothetical protein